MPGMRRVETVLLRYPGLIAPASLKQALNATPNNPVPVLSGVNRPGLIEALISTLQFGWVWNVIRG